MKNFAISQSSWKVLTVLVVVLLAGLPVAVWLDLRTISANQLTRQATDLNTVITGIRSFYATDVVSHVLATTGHTIVTDKYDSIPGAIPIPATFSLQLGRVIGEQQANIEYRFVSDYPFRHRRAHVLDAFERQALTNLRRSPAHEITTVSWAPLTTRVRLIAPVIMGQTCVSCHNSHPDSPKRDWKIGDVRGIQELSIVQPLAGSIFSFKYLLLYFGFAGCLGIGFIAVQQAQGRTIMQMNRELTGANDFLSSISQTISRYLSPQIYKSIFSGQTVGTIHTERKKLTIFFSDIKDFTSTTERLQPEELTALLNEYFTEMAKIALDHGGTVDKFVGDAILVFFGDPETKGVAEDARAALRMAVQMQRRLVELNAIWHGRGIEHPFRVRMGINTGYCNVGNFGSDDRMDYTIIGAEANLASRLESSAEPGQIVLSYETYALVRDIASAHPLEPITMKGISRSVVPYLVDGLLDADGSSRVFHEHVEGLDIYLDLNMAARDTEQMQRILREAAAALEARRADAEGQSPRG